MLHCAADLAGPIRRRHNGAVIDPATLWDFNDPAGSEARLRIALVGASTREASVLRTQVARALGLQQHFGEALAVLDGIESVDPEVHVRILLERGRVYRSSDDLDAAAPLFRTAVTAADTAGLDALAIDAMHMVALTLPAEDQVDYTRMILTRARASSDPSGRRWVASILNNLGMAHSDQGEWQLALEAFEEALAERLNGTDVEATHAARWMVAWALRNLGRTDEALAAQRALKADLAATGHEDPYVDEEIALLTGPT